MHTQTSSASTRALVDPISPAAALLAGKKTPPDAINLLMQDHRQVMGWFLDYQATNDAVVRTFLEQQICLHLKVHMQLEEQLFYVAAADATGDGALIDRAVDEHNEAKRIIAGLESGGGGAARQTLMLELEAAINAHVLEEETELFPEVRAAGLDLTDLGLRMAADRAVLVSEMTGKPLPSPSN